MTKQRAPLEQQTSSPDESLSIDMLIDATLNLCDKLPHICDPFITQLKDLRSRLAQGRLHLSVLGQFNRGKSTFLNALLGIKLLPTSVLPITSVPIIIGYGKELSCTVVFFSNKPDLVIRESPERISETLMEYVAEERNPKNRKSVKEVQVYCPSPLLENGTVLLDTPGFGSTYLHNTKTTLDLLSDCDAALFLLSADPPMTQTEVEFLKQVSQHVPRLFFALNKIDLLTPAEADKVDSFIKNILVNDLRFPLDTKVFRISAVKGGDSKKRTSDDKQWVESGMDAVQRDILNFLVKEKYFALSEALTTKFSDSIDAILTILKKECDEYQDPINNLETFSQKLSTEAEALKKEMKKDLALVDIERQALIEHAIKDLQNGIDETGKQITTAFEKICSQTRHVTGAQTAASSVQTLVISFYEQLAFRAVTAINKPIQKAFMVHAREYDRIQEELSKLLHSEKTSSTKFADSFDTFDNDHIVTWKVECTGISIPSFSFADKLRSKKSLQTKLKNVLQPSIDKCIEQNNSSLSAFLTEHIESACRVLFELLSNDYTLLISMLDQDKNSSVKRLDRQREEGQGKIEELKGLVVAFEKIKNQIRG